MATPTALTVGIGKAAQQHILIKDAFALENMCRVNAIVLDKTGTLTEGTPKVVGEKLYSGFEEYVSVLLAAEMRSEHPLAVSLSEYLRQKGVKPVEISAFESITGKGVMCEYRGEKFWIGSKALAEENVGVLLPDLFSIYFGKGDSLVAAFEVKDALKENSKEAVRQLESFVCLPVIKSLRLPKSLVKQELPIMNGAFCPMIRNVLSWICNVGANVWLWSAMALTIHRHWHGPM